MPWSSKDVLDALDMQVRRLFELAHDQPDRTGRVAVFEVASRLREVASELREAVEALPAPPFPPEEPTPARAVSVHVLGKGNPAHTQPRKGKTRR